MSELSKVYGQYHDSLKTAQSEYEKRLLSHSKMIKERYDEYLNRFVVSFSDEFSNQVSRIELKSIAEKFFGSSDIRFVAIDASCDKRESENFISFYGGAYGSKGQVSLSEPGGKMRYHRWEMNKDVSMVAFVPLPPDVMQISEEEEDEAITVLSDREIAQVSSLHTKIMQLAEVYLAYSLAKASTIEKPNLILIDNSIGGILANSSFSPQFVQLKDGDFEGDELTLADMQIALAHPFNRELGIPSNKAGFQQHFRVIAEAVWKESMKISHSDCKEFPLRNFEAGVRRLEGKHIKAGVFDNKTSTFAFHIDPRTSWQKTLRVFERICDGLFREKNPQAITYKLKGKSSRQYFVSSDLKFLIGVGIRALIEECWKKNIMLIGVVKDSRSRYFYRNFLGSILTTQNGNIEKHQKILLTDRNIVEMLPNIAFEIKAPWSTIEFDYSFLTLHPVKEEGGRWSIHGYEHPRLGETTRPERIMLRSICQFFISEDRNISSHAIFVDRLAYPGWDDKESLDLSLDTPFFDEIKPIYFEKGKAVSKLQRLSMYLLSVLIKNHFPEALGYPDPLHQADWGAKSMKRRVLGLLESSEWAFRSRPLTKTFRQIRDSFR